MTYATTRPSPDDPEPSGGPPRGRGRRRLLTAAVAVAVLLAAGYAGWLAWRQPAGPSTGAEGPGGGGPAHTREPGPLAGRTVLIDPGHNPHNRDHPGEINRLVGIGTSRKACDTAGTATESGYLEADFTLDLARRVRRLLEEQGATVRFTQDGRRAWGPCVDERAEAGNRAHADAAVSLHADGAPAGNRGFHVILPGTVHEDGADTRGITGPSRRLGRELRDAFRASTGERPANYIGDGKGLDTREDLGGLNLSTVPKVFLECGNMHDPRDAAHLTDPGWRDRAARGVANGLTGYLARER